ncbi:MAG TPA: DinB family protein [Acidimicrobiales bacterium]|nr:DinB family protein [Acidimicrobiales bacterium]
MHQGVTRTEPPLQADERTMLSAWLDYHRATLLQKCDGLDGHQLARRSVPPSSMTLLGLVRHLTVVEWWWFEHIFADGPAPVPISSAVKGAAFDVLDPDLADADVAGFRLQCDHSRSIVARAEGLDVSSASSVRPTRDLRWILVHMIEEYARHNGHADLLRECIDGAVGE